MILKKVPSWAVCDMCKKPNTALILLGMHLYVDVCMLCSGVSDDAMHDAGGYGEGLHA
jgi:hypothetical protein